jgi:putative ATPase
VPECEVILAQCTTYLSRAKKSVEVYRAYEKVKQVIAEEPAYPVPLHLRNAPTKLMKDLGYSKGYQYNPDYEDDAVTQTYLPKELQSRCFFS